MAGFNRRDFLRRTGAGVASSAIPGGTGVGKVLAGLGDPVSAVASAVGSIEVDPDIFKNGIEMAKGGVFIFKPNVLNTLGNTFADTDFLKYLGIGDDEAKEIEKTYERIRSLTRNRRAASKQDLDEAARLTRSLNNRLRKVTITPEGVGDLLGKSDSYLDEVNTAIYWLKKNGADSKTLLKTFRSYTAAVGGAQKVLSAYSWQKDDGAIGEILEIPNIEEVIPEWDKEFRDSYNQNRQNRPEQSDEILDEPAGIGDDYGRDLEPDWYDRNEGDTFRKTKERFYESKSKDIHCFTEGYRLLVEGRF